MSELLKVVMTAAVTLLGGVILFIVNQWVQKFFFEPIHEQARVVGEIDFALTYWAWTYANPDPSSRTPVRDRASDELRGCGSRLIATTNAIPCYRAARLLGALDRGNLQEAAGHLIGLSNSIYHGEARWNSELAGKIRVLIGLPLKAS